MGKLQILPVVRSERKRARIHTLETANIDGDFGEGDALGERLYATCFTKEMLNDVFIKQILREIVGTRGQREFILINEIE